MGETLDRIAAEIDKFGSLDFLPAWDPTYDAPEYPRLDAPREPDIHYEAMTLLASCLREIRSIAWSPTAQAEADELAGRAQEHMDRLAAESDLVQVRRLA